MRNKFGAAIGGQTLLDEGPEGSGDFVRSCDPTSRNENLALACAGSTVFDPLPV